MNFSKTIKTFVTTILVAATSLPTIAQDKLAMQAPVDRKLKVLDTLALQSVLERESMEMPASASGMGQTSPLIPYCWAMSR